MPATIRLPESFSWPKAALRGSSLLTVTYMLDSFKNSHSLDACICLFVFSSFACLAGWLVACATLPEYHTRSP